MTDRVSGGAGNDTLSTENPSVNVIIGNGGNDYLDLSVRGGGAYGGMGDDTLIGGGPGKKQSHMYGGPGRDKIYFNTGNKEAPYGDHAWGGDGADEFHFTTRPEDTERITGRIDDFDITRDTIWLNNKKINLYNPPDNVKFVLVNDQPWIVIDGRILYALEGARQYEGAKEGMSSIDDSFRFGNGESEEIHFIDWPAAWENGIPESAYIPYHGFADYFPASEYKELIPEWEIKFNDYTNENDSVIGTDGNDRLAGGDGADTIHGGSGNDLIHGGEYDDIIYGGDGNDYISGGLDNDKLYGDNGNDIIYGGSGHDTIHGGDGNDRLYGNNGQDLIFGGDGNDFIEGGWHNDTIYGGNGNDTIYASFNYELDSINFRQKAFIDGGDGDDHIFAELNGDATISGGVGNDVIYMAKGANITITDFNPNEDFIDLKGKFANLKELNSMLSEVTNSDGGKSMVINMNSQGTITLEGLTEEYRDDILAAISNPMDLPKEPEEKDKDEGKGGTKNTAADGGGGCFVATACFGDEDHPTVAWLRKFRSQVLRRYFLGRVFIRAYWIVGPIAAKYVYHHGKSGLWMRSFLGILVKYGQRKWPDIR